MLSLAQMKYVEQSIYSSDHDYFFHAPVYGEPFLADDILHYFDGESLTLIGHCLNRQLPVDEVVDRIENIISLWFGKVSIRLINYFGPWQIDFQNLLKDSYVPVFIETEPDPYHVDVFIDLTDQKTLHSRNAKESIRKANRNDFTNWVGHRDILSYQHIDLLRATARRDTLNSVDVSELTTIMSLIRSRAVILFETWAKEHLAGVAVVHEFFANNPFLTLAFFDKQYPAASDKVYSTIIEHYRNQGSMRLGLGYAVHEGLYHYKLKWGGAYWNPPVFQSVWLAKGHKLSKADWLGWPLRVVMEKLPLVPDFPDV